MHEEDEVQEHLRRQFFPIDPQKIPAEVLPRVIEIVKESAALSKRIHALGQRLAAGDTSVQAELNPAIRRGRELDDELHELKERFGLLGPPVMYGSASRFRRDE